MKGNTPEEVEREIAEHIEESMRKLEQEIVERKKMFGTNCTYTRNLDWDSLSKEEQEKIQREQRYDKAERKPTILSRLLKKLF